MQQQPGGTFKDVAASLPELLKAVAIIVLVVWIVLGVDLRRLSKIVIPGGTTIELVEAAKASQESASRTEAAENKIVIVQDKLNQLEEAVAKFSGPQAADLKNSIAATQQAAAAAQSSIAEASQDTARALERISEVRAKIDPNAPPPPATGWYYLGKLSKDRTQWLPSSARDNLHFEPPFADGKDLIAQLSAPGITRKVYSTGKKYIRSEDTVSGNRAAGKIVRIVRPEVPVRIGEIDAKGVADGDTVVWALVQVPEER